MSGTTVNSQTQRIVVNAASRSISLTNAGPQGPPGQTGLTNIDLLFDSDGQLLTRIAGDLAPITRADLAADINFKTVINHGATASTARSGSHPIKWIGSVDPSNSTNDEWFNTNNSRQYVKISGTWVNIMSVPVGTILDYSGSVAPSNFLLINGSTIINGQTLYPDLWAVIPASWKSGSNIVLPDGRGRTTVGAGTGSGLTARTLGAIGGAETHTLSATESGVPAHSHTLGTHTYGMQSHTHTFTSGVQSANHTHGMGSHIHGQPSHWHTVVMPGTYGGGVQRLVGDFAGGSGSSVAIPNLIAINPGGYSGEAYAASGGGDNTYGPSTDTTSGVSVDHTHSGTTAGPSNNTTTGPTGGSDNNTATAAASAHNNMQPWLALNKMICCK